MLQRAYRLLGPRKSRYRTPSSGVVAVKVLPAAVASDPVLYLSPWHEEQSHVQGIHCIFSTSAVKPGEESSMNCLARQTLTGSHSPKSLTHRILGILLKVFTAYKKRRLGDGMNAVECWLSGPQ
jgi:hypothetical protein